MSTKWYKKAKTPRLWKMRAKETLARKQNDPNQMTEAASGDISESSEMSEVGGVADMSQEIKRGAPSLIQQFPTDSTADADGQNAQYGLTGPDKHKHPLMLFVELFNEITTIVQEDDIFELAMINELIDLGEDILEQLNDDNQINNLAESLDCIYDLQDQLVNREPFSEQYLSWFDAYNYLNRTDPQFSKHTAEVYPPDDIFEYDEDLIPEAAERNLEQRESDQDKIDEFFGIAESPDAKSDSSIFEDIMSDSPHDDYADDLLVPYSVRGRDSGRNISPAMMKKWRGMREEGSVKTDISLRRTLQAYDKAYDKIMAAGGGWVIASTLFTGLTQAELMALQDFDLIKIKNGKMTLTKLGYDPRGTVFDR